MRLVSTLTPCCLKPFFFTMFCGRLYGKDSSCQEAVKNFILWEGFFSGCYFLIIKRGRTLFALSLNAYRSSVREKNSYRIGLRLAIVTTPSPCLVFSVSLFRESLCSIRKDFCNEWIAESAHLVGKRMLSKCCLFVINGIPKHKTKKIKQTTSLGGGEWETKRCID